MPTANQFTEISEGTDEDKLVADEEDSGKGIDCNNVSSDWVNRIDYIPHIIRSKCLSVRYQHHDELQEHRSMNPSA